MEEKEFDLMELGNAEVQRVSRIFEIEEGDEE